MGVKESYELYINCEDQNAECISFHDYCRWWCMINGVDQHHLVQQHGMDKLRHEDYDSQPA